MFMTTIRIYKLCNSCYTVWHCY